MATFLTLDQVSKTYADAKGQRVHALDLVNLDIARHEIIALIGPSGCGKSTLLRLIAGLDHDHEGRIEWAEQPRPGRDIGFVFQEPALLPWRTVRRNVSLGLEAQGAPAGQSTAVVDELIDLVGLSEFPDSYPAQLSGGMRQRVSIIRALAYDPRILLMDEPFGALDAITREKLHEDLLRIWDRTRKTIVLVTHAVDEAAYLADRVVVMTPRPGRIKAIHDVPLPRDHRTPALRLVPEFTAFVGALREELA